MVIINESSKAKMPAKFALLSLILFVVVVSLIYKVIRRLINSLFNIILINKYFYEGNFRRNK